MEARRGNAWRPAVWGLAAALLLLPAVAMQFTREVQWTAFDFGIFGTMLLIACGAYEFAAWVSGNRVFRAAAGLAVLTGFLLTWINLAVGIIDDEHARANLLFFGVLLVGVVGACIARFRARGMVKALVATAMAQGAVGVIASTLGSIEAVALCVVFTGLWLSSAFLFKKAAAAVT